MDSGNAPQVLLSFARPDAARARRVQDQLKLQGIECGLDCDDLPTGADRAIEIKRAVRAAQVVLVCLTRQSMTRTGILQKDVRLALDAWKAAAPGQLTLIPVKLEECELNKQLAQFSWINLWEERGWQRLIKQIRSSFPASKSLNGQPAHAHAGPGAVHTASPASPVSPASSSPLSTAQRRRLQAEASLSIPYVTFPAEVRRFLKDSMPADEWAAVPDTSRRFVTTLGCKLEPIVQVAPATPTPLVLGFECLGLGALGESFDDICRTASDIDPGLLRLCLAVVAIKTVSTLRTESVKSGHSGARNLIFSINLDPFMLDSPHFKKFLLWYYTDLSHNVLFEVNETTTRQYLPRLKNLQADFNLRYSADDLNNWHADVRKALIDRVEMTKMDYRSFKQAMDVRGDDVRRSLDMLLRHNMADKPLIVEGIEDRDYLEFLERHWDFKRHGQLYGQGYCLDDSHPWNSAIQPLKEFRLPGGSYLATQAELPLDDNSAS